MTGEDLLELTADDLCTHIGATPLQARKIQNEVAKLTGMRTTSMSSAPSQAYSGAVAQAAAVQPTSPVARSATSPYAMEMEQGYKKESYDLENSPQPPAAMVGYPSGPPAAYPSGAYPPGAYPPDAYPAPQMQPSGVTNQNVNVVVEANQVQVGTCGGFQMTMWVFAYTIWKCSLVCRLACGFLISFSSFAGLFSAGFSVSLGTLEPLDVSARPLTPRK